MNPNLTEDDISDRIGEKEQGELDVVIITMDYVNGGTLEKILKHAKMDF